MIVEQVRTRATRRHLAARRKHWARTRCFMIVGRGGEDSHAADPRLVGKAARTPHPTSRCMCCRNPRSWEGPTRQELRAGEVQE